MDYNTRQKKLTYKENYELRYYIKKNSNDI